MKVEYIIIHHTGAEEKDAKQVRRYHLSLGWRDVGYNYIIERDGRVVAGRSLTIPGAHCRDAGMNHKSAGVAVIGNLMDHPPTPEQRQALIELARELCRRYSVPPERVLGHNEVPGAATDCPGRFLDMERLRAEAAAPAGDGGTTAGEAGNSASSETVEHMEGAARGGSGDAAAGIKDGDAATAAREAADNAAASTDANNGRAEMTPDDRDSGDGPNQAAVVKAGCAAVEDAARTAGGEDRAGVRGGPANLWRVQVGAFAKKENAEALAEKLRRDGYSVFIQGPQG
ncbi:N-acetylmuramoyl-L-alanine amidase [Moorella sulfitireducens]|uniref:N-acetylmuramoyl-L-alanine amidase n=1 Tax=Neomoorella sulfitireducens TaxID=2972948 RepID=UPI0021AC45B4|nr:N-acetylmuramoyl-L-alanine amidase [Moorella sulfitireducens]